jgi:hypothetical protein
MLKNLVLPDFEWVPVSEPKSSHRRTLEKRPRQVAAFTYPMSSQMTEGTGAELLENV